MKLRQEDMEALQAEISGRLKQGDELVAAGPAGLSGTSRIVKEKYNYLRNIFSGRFLKNAQNLFNDYKVSKEDLFSGDDEYPLTEAFGSGVSYEAGEGGLLAALWKLAEVSRTGLEVDLRKIPIRQETIEISEVFGIDPYRLSSHGAFLIGLRNGEAYCSELRKKGIQAAVIGRTVEGNDRLLYSGSIVRYLDRPKKDEVGKVLGL